jgi:adenine-specific DNA-methyltransferase
MKQVLFDELCPHQPPWIARPTMNGCGSGAKALGAYYTDAQVADFLVWWGIRTPFDSVIDPSFGGGVFLKSACERIIRMGGSPISQVYGVELDDITFGDVAPKIRDEYSLRQENLIHSDFFSLVGTTAPKVDVVVGNPPFIRYQRFAGEARKQALRRASEHGLKLSGLASSWLPFLVHSIGLIREGGRLAMVIPVEIGHAAYARIVLQHLSTQFAKTTFVTFRNKLFPSLNEDTLLLLAEDKGVNTAGSFRWLDVENADGLQDIRLADSCGLDSKPLPTESISSGRERLIEQWIPRKTRELYGELKKLTSVKRLGALADVGIGYVTGANDYFHLDDNEIAAWGIPLEFLRPAVRRGRSLSGLVFTRQDWRDGLATGESGYLLHIDPHQELTPGVCDYIARGEADGVARGFKCRTRSPWYTVPHVRLPDAFLTYMSGSMPRLVANDAGAVAPNSLHVLKLHDHSVLGRDGLATLWQTSLTALSAEIEGHALGGGMLKLEPTEAESVLLANPKMARAGLAQSALELNELSRNGRSAEIEQRANAEILQDGLGIGAGDCKLLSEAAVQLRRRRLDRGAS